MQDDFSLEVAKLFLMANHPRTLREVFEEHHKSHFSKHHRKIEHKREDIEQKKELPIPPTGPQTNFNFNLGRVNPLIQDNSVTIIQCDGPGILLNINQNNEMRQIDLALNEQEINGIIQKFSIRSNQSITEPVFQAQVDDLKLMAIISKYTSSRFIITRISN